MTERDKETDGLEAHFDAARRQAATPSDDLMRRVLSDALQAQAEMAGPQARTRPRAGWVRQVFGALGGWPAVAGLSTAAVAGVWLGVAPPAGLDEVAQGILGDGSAAYLADMPLEAAFGLDEGAL